MLLGAADVQGASCCGCMSADAARRLHAPARAHGQSVAYVAQTKQCSRAAAPQRAPAPRRSLAAAEQLSRAGYGTLAWINGGLDTAKKADLPIKGEFDDLRYGGIGGLSELLGWTDVQREKSAGFLGEPFPPISACIDPRRSCLG